MRKSLSIFSCVFLSYLLVYSTTGYVLSMKECLLAVCNDGPASEDKDLCCQDDCSGSDEDAISCCKQISILLFVGAFQPSPKVDLSPAMHSFVSFPFSFPDILSRPVNAWRTFPAPYPEPGQHLLKLGALLL